MNTDPTSNGSCRIAREDCEVGDWIEASHVPEWSTGKLSHVFRRERITISPQEGDMGGMIPARPQEWTFLADRINGRLVWVREQ
ncbi:hypothetical protein OKA04_14525 [Luteolibacter flavescens]|uniref:Uncharacterized protein n=1 Tax=Luteolibacter flavescens TaxID=1859460 RepID=A0ABT3FRU3_9BACT|nr:hypothetical protein [Luteolibacter flavescens]MCW1885951.1 hypothetical protein [Luteolibacter flavescens]